MPIPQRLLDKLRERRAKVELGGGAAKQQERHDKGLLTARERLEVLFDEGTFQESGAHIRHSGTAFGMADKDLPADGAISGNGLVNGRQVSAFSQDFTVAAGTLGRMLMRAVSGATFTGRDKTCH